MSASASDLPQDVTYTDLTPSQVAFLQLTVPDSAKLHGFVVNLQVATQPDGLQSVTVRYSKPATAPEVLATAAPLTTSAATQGSIKFSSGGRALTQAEFNQALLDLGNIEPQLLWALIKKESETLTGYLGDRRPVILYERHVFSRHTQHQYDNDPDISSQQPYVQYGSLLNQYTRLEKALQLNPGAALMACSWGLGQILGENATDLGYPNGQTMVSQMVQSEGLQLHSIVLFLKQKKAQNALSSKDWNLFAQMYNGDTSGKYAGNLQSDYNFYKSRSLPDLNLRAAQLYLTYLGYVVHGVDGIQGDYTRQALLNFQSQSGLPTSGEPDSPTMVALTKSALA